MEAQYRLGYMYYEGANKKEDFELAFQWIEFVASQGHREAQYLIATMYLNGEGVKKDLDQAREIFLKLADTKNHAKAQYLLGDMYLKGEGVKRQPNLAFKYIDLAR